MTEGTLDTCLSISFNHITIIVKTFSKTWRSGADSPNLPRRISRECVVEDLLPWGGPLSLLIKFASFLKVSFLFVSTKVSSFFRHPRVGRSCDLFRSRWFGEHVLWGSRVQHQWGVGPAPVGSWSHMSGVSTEAVCRVLAVMKKLKRASWLKFGACFFFLRGSAGQVLLDASGDECIYFP